VSAEPETTPPEIGEQIHVPTPSHYPVVLAVGVTLALVGITTTLVLTGIGLVIAVPTIVAWIRSAREDYSDLPPGH